MPASVAIVWQYVPVERNIALLLSLCMIVLLYAGNSIPSCSWHASPN